MNIILTRISFFMLIVLIGCNHHNSKDKNADAEINEITLANVDLSKLKLEQTFF